MRKIMSRIGLGFIGLCIVSVVLCFYLNQFTYAYALIILLVFIFGGMGAIYRLRNDEYMYRKVNGLSERDEYEEYTR
ncbi:hypothetical protein [Paenibacillus tengchongensis]|uniref:hypothetical protein n=1 Tax=Paenibacillus tengchongensis TaxID=2608684 RepID=UPI00124D6BF2|nr:hypothetical protein [Paenibacillus tengchongensis]